MQQPPRKQSQALLDRSLLLRAYGFLGIGEGILAMLGFFAVWWGNGYSLADLQAVTPDLLAHNATPVTTALYLQATTLTLAAVVACQTGNVFACRSEWASSLKMGLFSNPKIWYGIAAEWFLMLVILYSPVLNRIFSVQPLANWQWLLLLICPPIILGAEDIRKTLYQRLPLNRRHQA